MQGTSSPAKTALVVTLAALGGFVSSYEIGRRAGVGADLGILTTVLALTLGRRPHAFDSASATLREFYILAAVGVIANGVAFIFHLSYLWGAATFTVAMFFAIWLRQFDARAAEAGALLMFPLIALLIVPAPHLAVAPLMRVAFAIGAGSIALFWVRATQFLAVRIGFWRPIEPTRPDAAERTRPEGDVKPRFSSTTRFAIQMAVALAAAFTIGRLIFAEHAGWVVTTAFIVGIGNRGRGDVAYKSMLRIAGAIGWTLMAFAFAQLAVPQGPIVVAIVFATLFLGTWLRSTSYAYWALAITLVLAIVQHSASHAYAGLGALELRILAILAGAVCATAAAWFVMPIRTERVVLLRVSETLAAIDAVLKHDETTDGPRATVVATLRARADRLAQIAEPVRFHHRLVRAKSHDEHPANWIAIASECVTLAIAHTGPSGTIRRANGAARKSLGALAHPERIDPSQPAQPLVQALARLREALSR